MDEKYYDTEHDCEVLQDQLWDEYILFYGENGEITFGQYVRNCMTVNGGTLERIQAREV